MNIASIITNHASFQASNTAVICGDDGRKFTWLELEQILNKLGNSLIKIGVKKGDIVAVYLPNSPEFLFTYFAVARIGAINLPFNILFRTGEIAYILKSSKARVLIGASAEVKKHLLKARAQFPDLETVITVGDPVAGCYDFSSLIEEASGGLEPVGCKPDELVSLMYTSGTTGRPKGAMLTYSNLKAIGALSSVALHINDHDLLMTGAPFCHICFVLSVLGPFNVGAGVVTMKRFSPGKFLDLISRYRITHFTGVPSMFICMLQHYNSERHDLGALRLVHSAGAPMPVEYIREIEEKFGVGFIELYGVTETSSIISFNRLGHSKDGSVGRAAWGVEVKVVNETGNQLPPGEVGEILVRGPGIFTGYWEMPEATREAFDGDWYRTGDLGKYDENGYLYIVDRKKEMILCGGYNVYPREVEEIIYQHPKVMEAAVIGVKDLLRNEVPKAFVRLKDGEAMAEQELLEYCAQKLASYKVPRWAEFVNELPRSPSGKINKKMLVGHN